MLVERLWERLPSRWFCSDAGKFNRIAAEAAPTHSRTIIRTTRSYKMEPLSGTIVRLSAHAARSLIDVPE